MVFKRMNDNEDRRVLDCFYTQHGTKLFVENGVLIEQKLKSASSASSAVLSSGSFSVEPLVGGFHHPSYSPHPPPPPKERSIAEIKRDSYKRSIMTAQEGLTYYNRKHPTKKYALVRPIESTGFMRNGFWFHSVFLAKPVEDDEGLAERCFFAEVKANGVRFGMPIYLVTLCCPLDGTQATLGCDICNWMPHPLSGFLIGNPQFQPRVLRSSRFRCSLNCASSSSHEMNVTGAKSEKGGEGGGGRKKHTFCLKIEDLHKYIPNFDASDNDWMQYM